MKLAAPWCAIAARCAEDMYTPGNLAPDLDERLAGWRIVGHLTALNALLGAQLIGAGDRVWYGFVAQENADPTNYIVDIRAALASYFARDLTRHAAGRFKVEAQLFACPKPGFRDFATNFDNVLGRGNYAVYNFTRDIVPHFPPGFLGYADLPNVIQIKPSNALAPLPQGSSVLEVIKANHNALNYALMLGALATNPGANP